MSVNKVILVGNVGKDPETRYLDEGTAFTKFSMATSETYKNKAGERVSTTEWHNVVLWRGLAQVAEKYVKKGTQLYIEGRIKTRSYDDQDGNKKYITEIVGDQMQLLSRKPDDAGGQGSNQSSSQSSNQASTPASSQDGNQGTQAAPAAQTPNTQTGGAAESGNGGADPFGTGDNGPDDLPF
ncbi:MAG: single-stranded DNA-binding protein [Bacteroides sp.]|nr:single-stranded DNA-binding protein [Bacteroides sp.]